MEDTGKELRYEIGSILRNRRKELQFTQGELGELVGVTKSTISSIENGRFAISLDYLEVLCNKLNLVIELRPDKN